MVKLLRFALWVCLSLAGIIEGIRVAALHQPVPDSISLLHLIDCTAPCWLGIMPGSTTVEEAKAKIIGAYGGQSELKIEDSGFADGPVSPNVVENTIEGTHFFLVVRLDISQVVDGRSETVQSIHLSEPRAESRDYAPTVADLLGIFGPPQGIVVDELLSSSHIITLEYNSLEVIFHTDSDRIDLSQNPQIYLANHITRKLSAAYRPWKGFSTLLLGK
jgi:hypothetical protein